MRSSAAIRRRRRRCGRTGSGAPKSISSATIARRCSPHPTPEATERSAGVDGCGCPPGSSRHISRRGFVKFHPLVKLISGSSLFGAFLRLRRRRGAKNLGERSSCEEVSGFDRPRITVTFRPRRGFGCKPIDHEPAHSSFVCPRSAGPLPSGRTGQNRARRMDCSLRAE